MRNFFTGLFCLIAVACAFSIKASEISDFGAAKEWCDNALLDRIEGIWEYPDDHTSVLIRRSVSDNSLYEIIVVETPDTRLYPGDKIGYLKQSPDPDKFEMGVYRVKGLNGLFGELGKCLAQYNAKDGAICVKGRKLKFSLGSRYLLPAFWRMLRVSVKDPLESLPKGLIRIYPNPGRRQPDYL